MFSFFTSKTPKQQTLIIIGVFALFILIFYGNSLQSGFVYDDHQQIKDNEYVHSMRYLPKVILGCIWENAVGQCNDTIAYYRPLQTLSYLVTYQVSSAPWVFHLVNLFYLLATVSLIYFVGRELTKNRLLSFVAAFVFLIHPLNTEVVNWASAVPELTFAIFVLLSFLFYVKWRNGKPSGESLWAKQKYFVYAVVFYVLAILSKEPAVLLPVLFLFFDLFVKRISWKHLVALDWKRFLSFPAVVLVYAILRLTIFGGNVFGDFQHYGPFTFFERIYAFATLFAQYIGKLVYPHPLLFFYTFDRPTSIFTFEFLISLIVLGGFVFGFVYLIKKGKPLLALHMLWIVFLLPVLIAINRVGENIFSERYMFIPTIGFAFLIATGFVFLWERQQRFRMGIAVVALIIVLMSFFVVYNQNKVWKSNESLYPATLDINPRAHSVRFNLGVLLRNDKNDFEGAKREFEEILRLDSTWFDTPLIYVHLGDYYRDVQQDREKAFEQYQISVDAALGSERAYLAYGRIGALHAINEEYIDALPFFCKAVQLEPDVESTQGNFNRISGILGDLVLEDPKAFKEGLSESKEFKVGEPDRIQHTGTSCNEKVCIFSFDLGPQGTSGTILPFLILAQTERGTFVNITNRGYDAQTAEAKLETEAAHKNQALTFVFPTCEGVYYELPLEP